MIWLADTAHHLSPSLLCAWVLIAWATLALAPMWRGDWAWGFVNLFGGALPVLAILGRVLP